jgi:hypothetical protein
MLKVFQMIFDKGYLADHKMLMDRRCRDGISPVINNHSDLLHWYWSIQQCQTRCHWRGQGLDDKDRRISLSHSIKNVRPDCAQQLVFKVIRKTAVKIKELTECEKDRVFWTVLIRGSLEIC